MTDRLPVVSENATPDAPSAAPPATSPGNDPFPRERFVGLVARLPRYLRLAWGLAGEPRLSTAARAGVVAAAAYLASPIDAIPGVIPVVGQIDDIAVALFALRTALRALDPATRARHLAAAGLGPEDLDRDLGTLAVTAAWLARRGIAISRRLARLAATASIAAGRAGARAARRGAPVAARAAGGVARGTTDAVRRGVPAGARAGGRLVRGGGQATRAAGGAAAGTARAVGGALARPGRIAAAWARDRRAGADAPADEPDQDAGAGI